MNKTKIEKIQKDMIEVLQKEPFEKAKKEILGVLMILRLDVRIDLETVFKEAKAKGITDVKSISLHGNQLYEDALKLCVYSDIIGTSNGNSDTEIKDKLIAILSQNFDEVIVTEDVYQSKFFNQVWNEVK